MKMFRFEHVPRFHEIDSYGIVHHSAYFWWFEEGRIQFLRNCGVDLRLLHETGLQFVLSQSNVLYKAPVKPRQPIWVQTSLVQPSRYKLTFKQEVVSPSTREVHVMAKIDVVSCRDGALQLSLPDSILSAVLTDDIKHLQKS